MTTLELGEQYETSVEVVEERSFRHAAGVVLDFASRHLRMVPLDAPDFLSEHFDHAEKRNDLTPELPENVL